MIQHNGSWNDLIDPPFLLPHPKHVPIEFLLGLHVILPRGPRVMLMKARSAFPALVRTWEDALTLIPVPRLMHFRIVYSDNE
jgi:hypothetical protein